MKRKLCLAAVVSVAFAFCSVSASASPETDREALEKTGAAIRAAFAAGDLSTVMKYHHPDVTKAWPTTGCSSDATPWLPTKPTPSGNTTSNSSKTASKAFSSRTALPLK